MPTRITPNTDTFYAVIMPNLNNDCNDDYANLCYLFQKGNLRSVCLSNDRICLS